jgi:uncharacterized protein YukE
MIKNRKSKLEQRIARLEKSFSRKSVKNESANGGEILATIEEFNNAWATARAALERMAELVSEDNAYAGKSVYAGLKGLDYEMDSTIKYSLEIAEEVANDTY